MDSIFALAADFDLDLIENVCVDVIWMRNVQSYPLCSTLYGRNVLRVVANSVCAERGRRL